ncbi:MAG: PAS/PAC sensor signal transduction histidine kinase [Candidatus Curtissbacteria bacterium GW2011_GWC2_38_9]|uniref:histidine kinase n=1 Tax=Candidatus Curtissbacteria bacterium GW2011_GWC2_38_9 TaxID=1618414 RepID=A0A0G0LN39_9BACT|nr:MAG: PAS/PAC sensor signal transduction histidine kinase [Candidatus Curtissbacteria bacterium GW2011_GWC2_38_9]
MSIIDIILLVSSFVTAFLSLAVLFYSLRTKADIFFSIAALASTLWILSMFFYRISSDFIFINFFGHLLYYAGISIAVAYYLFSANFLSERKILYPLHIFIYGALIGAIFLLPNLFIRSIDYSSKTMVFGPTYFIYSILMVGYFLISFSRLISTRKQLNSDLRKKQIDFAFFGTSISIVIGLAFDIIIPFFGGFRLFWLGPAAVTFMVVSISYAIFEHNLFDIKVVAAEFFGSVITIISLVQFIRSQGSGELIFNGVLFLGFATFSILLVRGVLKEVRLREQIEKLAEDLRVANVELKKLDQLKSEFLSLATHQLRTPLTITKGYVSMIQEGTFGVVPQKIRDVLSKVYLSNERLINLVNDFLNLSRIESGRMKYNFEPMRADALVENAVEEFKELAKEKKIDLIWEKPSGPLPEAMIDKEKFHQVLMNIIDNAFKYCKEGHIEVSMSEEAGRGSADKNVLIQVKDSGVGMTREELDSIFKKFARAQSGSKVNTEGTGLGLYLAKRIVNDHGGEIWAQSEGHGLGSTFKIRLPAKGEEARKAVQFKEFVEKI